MEAQSHGWLRPSEHQSSRSPTSRWKYHHEQMREDVTNSVQDKITRKILLAVGEVRLDEFMRLLDGDDVSAVLNWCANNGVNLVEIVQASMNETMIELQKLYNDALNMIRG